MEFVAYLANEPHSHKPECACPVLTKFVVGLNDNFNNEERQKLKPFLPRILNTRDGKSLDRAKLLAWKAGTVFAPIALEITGRKNLADNLRETEYYNFNKLNERCRSASTAVNYATAPAALAASYAACAAEYAAECDTEYTASADLAATRAVSAVICAASTEIIAAVRSSKVFNEGLKALDEAIKL